ncbi:hypothetical protein P8V03_04960 [Clostridium sp. A1-XYC3]|uniref:Uncharacterized protein n=1 Tax=Clostridium tanneri TaxID=3037988 RepID=A0ABU4JQU1_9CLOT|nr:hypothetical protein [Clostridium sp. A1-XYC3]MDW8800502.1 hypothetical protein [Clostridium sp. A1-XYC3]
MYIAFGNQVIDSKEIKETIEENTEFKVIKDMSKGSKREDILAFNLSVGVDVLKDMMEEDYEEDYNVDQSNEDDLFEEYLTLAEDLATDIEEYIPEEAILDIRAYKLDESYGDIKLIAVIAHEGLGELKLRDIMKRLLTQAE